MSLSLEDQSLNFQMQIKEKKAILFNGPEVIELPITRLKKKFILSIANFNAALETQYEDGEIKGHWIKYDKIPEYKVKFQGKRITKIKIPLSINKMNLPSKWKIDFIKDEKVESNGVLLFSEKNNISFASILTSTGDYRYLIPKINGDQITLTGFDGIFAFKLIGIIKENKIQGMMYAGKSFSQKFTATADKKYELEDPTKITKVSSKALNVCLPELAGEKMCLNTFSEKIKVIQLFGSWCPNCIDETKFITQYKKENKNSDIEYFIISFERSLSKESALKSLKKTKKLLNIDYPILIGAYTKETKVSDVLKGIDNFIAFPTMIIIDKKGKVQKVHAGFSGPATGKYYEDFKNNFHETIKGILKQ